MNDEDRQAAADIVRGLRRRLERELHAGHGELLARAATPGRAVPPAAPAGGAPAGPAAPGRAGAPGGSAPPAAAGTDLFGNPIVRPAAPAAEPVAPSVETTLNPIDPVARRAIAAAAVPVLEAIAAEVRACRKCALWESRNQAVPGVGAGLSGIAFVGEAPGADEDRLGEPFVGRGGQLLDRIIKAMDEQQLIPGVPLNRQTVFIGNVLHCRPPENRVPLPFEVEQSSPFLRRQLEALRPRIICCLGKTAGEHLLGARSSLAGMRGQVYRLFGAKLIVTYHPAAVLRNPGLKRPVWEDMQLLAREYLQD